MTSLFHQPVCPFSRKVRLMLGEKKFSVEFVEERPWERRLDFLMLNPSGEVPVLVGEAGTIAGHYAICEWLEEKGGALQLLPQSGLARAEVRRLTAWFDDKFFNGQKFEFAYNRGELGNNENQDDEGPEERYFKNGDTVVVQFVSLDRPNFYYFRALEDQWATNGSPFASPGNLPSNINGGLGVFSGYGSAYDTVICVP